MIFIDERVGEFQYEISGAPEYPSSFETITFSSNLDNNLEVNIPVAE